MILLVAFIACKKTNNDAPTTKLTTVLNVVNASADTVNFYLNGTRLNSKSNLFPYITSGYMPVLAGTQNYQVKKAFNTATSTVQQLFNISLDLDTAQNYSLFIAGETQAQAFKTIDTLKSDTSSSTCLVRFVNASPDANTYDLAVGSATKLTGKSFGKGSSFLSADTGSKVPVILYQAGTTTEVANGTVSLLPQKSYTIYSTGKLNGTGSSKLNLAIMAND
jgi:hypothetical protein